MFRQCKSHLATAFLPQTNLVFCRSHCGSQLRRLTRKLHFREKNKLNVVGSLRPICMNQNRSIGVIMIDFRQFRSFPGARHFPRPDLIRLQEENILPSVPVEVLHVYLQFMAT